MPMYNLIQYSDNYSRTSTSWQYCRDEPFLDNNGAIADFLLIIITVLRLYLKQKKHAEQEMMVQKMLILGYH